MMRSWLALSFPLPLVFLTVYLSSDLGFFIIVRYICTMTIQLCRDFNDFYDKVRNDGRKKLQFHRLGCDWYVLEGYRYLFCMLS